MQVGASTGHASVSGRMCSPGSGPRRASQHPAAAAGAAQEQPRSSPAAMWCSGATHRHCPPPRHRTLRCAAAHPPTCSMRSATTCFTPTSSSACSGALKHNTCAGGRAGGRGPMAGQACKSGGRASAHRVCPWWGSRRHPAAAGVTRAPPRRAAPHVPHLEGIQLGIIEHAVLRQAACAGAAAQRAGGGRQRQRQRQRRPSTSAAAQPNPNPSRVSSGGRPSSSPARRLRTPPFLPCPCRRAGRCV